MASVTPRKKLTETQVTLAFIIGGGITLLLIGFLLAAAQSATPGFDRSRLNLLMIVGGTLFVLGTIAWLFLTRPWKDFDDWSTPLYTGHDDHGHAAVAAPAAADTVHAAAEHSPVSVVSAGQPQTNDLTAINGIGPKISAVLNNVGIHTFADLAARQPTEIERIILDSGIRVPHNVKAWIDEAQSRSSNGTPAAH
ncbi:MAG: helix-hairpin-helix domain-containing protein [Chloroflexota bacterium]